ncbi:MAG: T9SS type A sorting domain-containing protein [Hyphomicrobiales bacterium]
MNKEILIKQVCGCMLLAMIIMMNQSVFAGVSATRGLEKIKEIPAQDVEIGIEFLRINLDEYFSSGEGETIEYEIENGDVSVVESTLYDDDQLRLSPLGTEEKSATITITASLGEEELSSTFVASVKQPKPDLRLLESVSDQILRMNGNVLKLNMLQYFTSHPTFDISYETLVVGENLIEISFSNGMMDIVSTKGNTGLAAVRLTATAGDESLTEEFTVEVKDVVTEIEQIKEFDDVEMQSTDAAYELDMSEYFTCNAAYELSYVGYSWNTSLAYVSMEEGKIKLNVAVNQEGESRITVDAFAGGDVLKTEFQLTVSKTEINLVKVKDIPAQSMHENEKDLTIDLSEYFTCSEGYTIIYEESVSDTAIATVSVDENILTIACKADTIGTVDITVDARIGIYKETSIFELMIGKVEGVSDVEVAQLDVYPNPVSNYFVVDSPGVGSVEIYTNQGALVSTYEVNRNRNRIEVGDLVSGIYFVKLISGDSISVGKMLVK